MGFKINFFSPSKWPKQGGGNSYMSGVGCWPLESVITLFIFDVAIAATAATADTAADGRRGRGLVHTKERKNSIIGWEGGLLE